jgi:hypothetical protein
MGSNPVGRTISMGNGRPESKRQFELCSNMRTISMGNGRPESKRQFELCSHTRTNHSIPNQHTTCQFVAQIGLLFSHIAH